MAIATTRARGQSLRSLRRCYRIARKFIQLQDGSMRARVAGRRRSKIWKKQPNSIPEIHKFLVT